MCSKCHNCMEKVFCKSYPCDKKTLVVIIHAAVSQIDVVMCDIFAFFLSLLCHRIRTFLMKTFQSWHKKVSAKVKVILLTMHVSLCFYCFYLISE